MDKDKSKIYKNLRNAARVVVGFSELTSGIALANPVTGIIAAPLMYDGATRFLNGVQGTSKNNSMMITSENKIYNKLFKKPEYQITQNIPDLGELIRVAVVKDKEKMLITQELNFLLGAKRLDDNGEKIKYNTKSQSLTKFMLSRAQKSGFIENFESVQSGESSLIAEKIITGNFKGIRRKKTKMFDMSFNLSDKEITDADIIKFLKVDTLDSKKFDIVRDKEGKITSVNLSTMTAIKESLNKAKEKYLPSSQNKMLNSSKESSEIVQEEISNDSPSLQNEILSIPETEISELEMCKKSVASLEELSNTEIKNDDISIEDKDKDKDKDKEL